MKHKYHILEWKAPDIVGFLSLAEIYLAVFNFHKPVARHYELLVAGFDEKGNLLGTSSIENYPWNTEPDLDNAYSLGLFFVKASDLKKYSNSGAISLYFEPKSYTPPGVTQEYVCYGIHNEPPKDYGFDINTLVGTINPSPPRNAGA